MRFRQFWGLIIELHTPGWRRRGWLAAIAGAHLLAFLCWQPPQRPLAASVAPHAPITYILTPFKRPAPPERALQPARPRAAPLPPAAAAPARSEPQAITVPATAAEPVAATPLPDPFALPAKPQEDAKQRAITSAGAIDQQLRKEAWTQRDRKYVNDETALATAIGKAYKGEGGAIGEFTAPDGSRVTKWRLPGGAVVCYYQESNNFSGGRDPFRDTGRLSARSCP